eukprot:1193367-Prorocentrum_minimum.AAC.2
MKTTGKRRKSYGIIARPRFSSDYSYSTVQYWIGDWCTGFPVRLRPCDPGAVLYRDTVKGPRVSAHRSRRVNRGYRGARGSDIY